MMRSSAECSSSSPSTESNQEALLSPATTSAFDSPTPPRIIFKATRNKPPRPIRFRSDENQGAQMKIEIQKDHPRPVIYRMKTFPPKPPRRIRVTRQIVNEKILQLHLDNPEKPDFPNVPMATVGQTIENYLQYSNSFMVPSNKYIDEIRAVGIEYNGSVKILYFAFNLHKHSRKQKCLKFQSSWWERKNRKRFAKSKSGLFRKPKLEYNMKEDPNLYECHFLNQENGSQLEKVIDLLLKRLLKRRGDNDSIPDSMYFVREFYLTKPFISLRITRSSDIPESMVPPTLRCGYFPNCATTEKNKKDYLFKRYEEATLEYGNLNMRRREIPDAFKKGKITSDELWKFHKMGRHIHGFFVVWNTVTPVKMEKKRYLVDTFFHIKFPINVEFQRWDNRMKLAFDRVSVYLLHLTEILRANRPVFNLLAKSDSLFQPTSHDETVFLMKEQGINPKMYLKDCGHSGFYQYGVTTGNHNYLSAFFIICGGSKVLRSLKFKDMPEGLVAPYARPPRVQKDLEISDQQSKLPTFTRTITPIGKVNKKPAEEPSVKVCNSERTFSRWEFSRVGKKRYVFPEVKKPGRKPKTPVEIGEKRHDFDDESSDLESEYEGFLDESENINGSRPRPTRSQSTDSFFLQEDYVENIFSSASLFYQQRIHRPTTTMEKTRRRRMNRIKQKYHLRFKMLECENSVYQEMTDCFLGDLENTKKERDRIKKCILEPHKFKKFDIPAIFEPGDEPLIDDVFNVLKSAVVHIEGEKWLNTNHRHSLTKDLQSTLREKRRKLTQLPKENLSVLLPKIKYLIIRILTGETIFDDNTLASHQKDLSEEVSDLVERHRSLGPEGQRLLYQRVQNRGIAEEYLRKNRLLEAHYKRLELKIIEHERSSRIHALMQEDKRRMKRRVYAEKCRTEKKAGLSEEQIQEARKIERRQKDEENKKRAEETERKRLKKNVEMAQAELEAFEETCRKAERSKKK